MTLEHTIRGAYIDTLLDGGFTRLVDRTVNPTEGYIVGGVTEPTTMYSEANNKYEMLLHQHTSGKYGGGMGMGTWIHEGQIYFDLVQHLYNLDVATDIAMKRGEIAIYDCKKQKDILL